MTRASPSSDVTARASPSSAGCIYTESAMGKGNKVRKKEVKKPKQDKNKKGAAKK